MDRQRRWQIGIRDILLVTGGVAVSLWLVQLAGTTGSFRDEDDYQTLAAFILSGITVAVILRLRGKPAYVIEAGFLVGGFIALFARMFLLDRFQQFLD